MCADAGPLTMLPPALLLFAFGMKIVSAADWCYQSKATCNHSCTDPDTWVMVSEVCRGKAQSPVNIVTRRALPDHRLAPLAFAGYDRAFNGLLANNGHAVQLDLPGGILVSGGQLVAPYKAVQLHLHWGSDGGPGSEHTVDGERFPMEMHIVHIKEEYGSLPEALEDPRGVAVLGFFFQESYSVNRRFDPFIRALRNITRPGSSTTLRGVTLAMLTLPQSEMAAYFRYLGSLTTPNCEEAVVWTVFENAIPLSREQLAAFSRLRFSNGRPMVNTYRPVQPLHGRQVFYSRGRTSASMSATVLLVSMLGLSTNALK